jgi:hypothetical protein
VQTLESDGGLKRHPTIFPDLIKDASPHRCWVYYERDCREKHEENPSLVIRGSWLVFREKTKSTRAQEHKSVGA